MDFVCEVQSDKSAVEISSPFTGTVLKRYHKVGALVKVKFIINFIMIIVFLCFIYLIFI